MARKARLPGQPPRWLRWARVLWASPNTLIGLAFGLVLLLATRARWRRVGGTLEIAALRQAPRRRWPFAAITLGHVIVGTHAGELDRLPRRPRHNALEAAGWGFSEAVTPNALDVALHRIRRKLQAIGSQQRIVNIRGIGYALRHDV